MVVAIALFFVAVSALPAWGASTPFVIDQPGSGSSAALSPAWLAAQGVRQIAAGSLDCTAFLDAVPGGPWYNASGLVYVRAQIAATKSLISKQKAAGLAVFSQTDIFQLPTLLIDRYLDNLTYPGSTCIGYRKAAKCIDLRSSFTQKVMSDLFSELQSTFPDIDGIIFRYGENSPCNYHLGNAPYDLGNPLESLQLLLQFLREELCVKRNLTVVFRTWDVSTSSLHSNASFYEAVTGAVAPHPKLVFSIKHTMLDFWRRVRFNPTLGLGRQQQVVEAEVGGMYGGCGSWPLYIGESLINHYEEAQPDARLGLRSLVGKSTFAGVLTNHQCDTPAVYDPYFWWRLEQAVITRWAVNTSASEATLFDDYLVHDLGISSQGARAALRDTAIRGMTANLMIQTCAAFDAAVDPDQTDRPTANWMLWDAFGGLYQLNPESAPRGTCHASDPLHCQVFPYLYNNSLFPAALTEKAQAVSIYEGLNSTAHSVVAPAILNATVAKAFLASVRAGVYVSRIVFAGWSAMAAGYSGDRSGHYNTTALCSSIADYDAVWAEYRQLPAYYPTGLMTDAYWEHPTSGQPGMGHSVDQYRHLCK